MIALSPILMALMFAAGSMVFSLWRSKRELAANSRALQDPVLEAKFRDLARALDVPQVRVLMLDTDGINGMAAPDGKIYVTRGLYDQYRLHKFDADEIAFVIAHELGHVALGHARRRMADFMMQSVLQATLTVVTGRLFPRLGLYLARLLVQLLSSRLMHKDEYEADEYAAALMAKAGLDATAPMRMLEKLGRIAPRSALAPVWLSSHPAIGNRVAAIEALYDKWQISPSNM